MLECKNVTWRQLIIQHNHKNHIGSPCRSVFNFLATILVESSSSHKCVRIVSFHFDNLQQLLLFAATIFIICWNYFLFAATLFNLQQLYFICCNFILFAAILFNLQQLFYLQQLFLLFVAIIFYLQQLYLICSNFFICSMSPVGHRTVNKLTLRSR